MTLPISSKAQSKNLALVIGGVHPDGPNPFKSDIKALQDVLNEKNWEAVALIGESSKKKTDWFRPSSNENITAMLKLLEKFCFKNDQTLILFQGHGMAPSKRFPSASHFISAEFEELNLDSLVPYLNRMNAKGCKTALIDLSCYSGVTQNLKAELPNTCIGTLASRDYVSVCVDAGGASSFMKSFIQNIQNGKQPNLQQLFLSARYDDKDNINLPELSSMSVPAQSGWDLFLKNTDPSGLNRRKVSVNSAIWNDETSLARLSSRETLAAQGIEKLSSEIQKLIEPLPLYQKSVLDPIYQSILKELEPYRAAWSSLEKRKESLVKAMLTRSLRISLEESEYRELQKQLDKQANVIMTLEREFFQSYYKLNPAPQNPCTAFQM